MATPSTKAKDAPGDARVKQRRHEMEQLEAREPLRRRILDALAQAPASPTDVAIEVRAAKESVSRRLRQLATEGLVTSTRDPDDGRRSVFALTHAGVTALSRHRAFGAPEPAPGPPTPDETLGFLRASLRSAVRMRRMTNRLGDAAERLRVILDQAREAGDPDLTLEARAELLTTLRQDRQTAEVAALLGELEQISMGHDSSRDPSIVAPALAYRHYAFGRLPEMSGGCSLSARAQHLATARILFRELATSADPTTAARWKEREAWSVVSLAGNLRERSDFEWAITRTHEAMTLFEESEDVYGRARCLFMLGFCWRLMGDFDEAWSRLSQGYEISSSRAFERFEADALMQMGEVRRCQGNNDDARELLSEALARADQLNLTVTQAFARSALGAVEWQRQEYAAARSAMEQAHELFEACGHQEGLALNARRQAIVARSLRETKQRGEIGRIRSFLRLARGAYQQPYSPAGIFACDIERGRLALARDEDVAKTIDGLIARVDDTPQRLMLEQDPWVPHVLADFAQETGHAGLVERAGRLLAASAQRLARWGSTPRQSGSGHPERFEMGGETRRQVEPVELLQSA